MKILFVDIETAPNLCFTWGIWDQNIPITNIVDAGYILCWSAKFRGGKEIHFASLNEDGEKKMLKKLHALLDEADVVIGWNSDKFDLPTVNLAFIKHRMTPPAPYKSIDLMKVVKRRFKFQSNKLAYVTAFLGLPAKTESGGMELWKKCMAGDAAALEKMKKYNKNDVKILEPIYDLVLAWIPNHPNHSVYTGHDHSCPHCGSKNVQSRGTSTARTLRYRRFQCNDCGTWSRANKPLAPTGDRLIP